MEVLYDAIGTVSGVLGTDLYQDRYKNYLLIPLLKKWESLNDDDIDLFTLLECLSRIAISMGPAFVEYSKPIFDRSLRLIEMVLLGTALHMQEPSHPLPNREFLICSMDMISALCDALRVTIEPLIVSSKLIPLLIEVCKDQSPDYCQSAFALVGDIAKYSTSVITNVLPVLIPLLIKGARSIIYRVANNAVWALGEIIIKISPDHLQPYVEDIYNTVEVVFGESEDRKILETCAVTIGRLGINFPKLLAPNLKLTFKSMCQFFKAFAS